MNLHKIYLWESDGILVQGRVMGFIHICLCICVKNTAGSFCWELDDCYFDLWNLNVPTTIMF